MDDALTVDEELKLAVRLPDVIELDTLRHHGPWVKRSEEEIDAMSDIASEYSE